ncbi:hypothetical protein NDU88_006869 [Pleurodeles waltl]|uniref:Uncharacterized protein n=1 Tax=Pleurodeles waltl TaxID=8319 RepID=A0AAV7WFQ3_PLEWA|nr:hypothetical protein NDU88_006869 [Pleurodeles waltl]
MMLGNASDVLLETLLSERTCHSNARRAVRRVLHLRSYGDAWIPPEHSRRVHAAIQCAYSRSRRGDNSFLVPHPNITKNKKKSTNKVQLFTKVSGGSTATSVRGLKR